MSKIAVIVGATGGQGGSVVSAFLEDKTFKVRGITRNPESKKAKDLAARGVEVVRADLNDEASLVKAFEGAHTIFAVTDFFEPFAAKGAQHAMEVEYSQGTNLAKAAAKTASLERYIWSTLPDSKRLSNGKWPVPHFEAKVRVDEFIKQDKALLAKTTFLWVTFYATNLFFPIYTPIHIVRFPTLSSLLRASTLTFSSRFLTHHRKMQINIYNSPPSIRKLLPLSLLVTRTQTWVFSYMRWLPTQSLVDRTLGVV
jgi:hypothetical protein